MRHALLAAALALTTAAQAQFEIQNSHTTASFRGIHSIGNGTAWASGTEGTVLRTTDDGKTWQHCTTPPIADKLDFRGIQAFDQNTAIVMSSGKGDLSRLYKTTDACKTWKLLFTNPDKDGFWDALQFTDRQNGYLLGDPVLIGSEQTVFAFFRSIDGGQTWNREASTYPITQDAAIFAASNSSMLIRNAAPIFVTGGSRVNLFISPETLRDLDPTSHRRMIIRLPLAEGTTAGGFSLTSARDGKGVVVGGDYSKPNEASYNAAYSIDGHFLQWQPAQTPPHGYRSSIAYDAPTKTWITTGPNGTDISRDDGRNWSPLKPSPQDAPDADKNWNALSLPFVVGPKGRIGRLRADALKH
jgi:photosystem II stability/assembly factor-like uncharacterized protein